MFSGGNTRLPRAVQMSAQANASSVSKNDLIKIVATKAGVSQETTRSVLESLTDTIMNAVAKGDSIVFVPSHHHRLHLHHRHFCYLCFSQFAMLTTNRVLYRTFQSYIIGSLTTKFLLLIFADQKVGIVGFGTFERNVRAARIGRNPATGAELQIPEKAVPTFKSGKIFKDTVEKSYTPTP